MSRLLRILTLSSIQTSANDAVIDWLIQVAGRFQVRSATPLGLMDWRGLLGVGEDFSEHLKRGAPAQGLTWSGVEAVGDGVEFLLRVDRQVRALEQVSDAGAASMLARVRRLA